MFIMHKQWHTHCMVKKTMLIWSLRHINVLIKPISWFSVHVNTTFRCINQNYFSPIETKVVHVNIAIMFVLVAVIFPGSGRCVPGYRCPDHHTGSHQGTGSDSWTPSGWSRKSSGWRWWLVSGLYVWPLPLDDLWTPGSSTVHNNMPPSCLLKKTSVHRQI